MFPMQQIVVGLDVTIPTVMDVGQLTYDVVPSVLVMMFL